MKLNITFLKQVVYFRKKNNKEMRVVKGLLRLNFIRNHFIKFDINGILLKIRRMFFKKNNKSIQFKHSEFKEPFNLRINNSEIDSYYQVLFNLEYEIKINESPKVIIDLVANIGLAAIYFLNKYPNFKVISVEPEFAIKEFENV